MLERFAEPVAYETAFWLQGVEDPAYPLERLGTLCLEVSERFRALAIIALTTAGSIDGFCHNLIRSGRTRLHYLRRIRAEHAEDDHHYASGRYAPLLDAVAAGDMQLAREIASSSPREWRGRHEYLDDYCFGEVIQRLVMSEEDRPETRDLLERHAQYLEGRPDARLEVAAALLDGDRLAFEAAFDALVEEYDLRIQRDMDRGKLETPMVLAERRIFVEGLAMLRLAELRGIGSLAERKYCPSLALRPMRTPFPGA